MRAGIVVGLPLLLAACAAIPPAVSIATWAVDGATLALSGKTVSDHVISAVTQKDCALWRLMRGRSVCVDHVAEDDPAEVAGAGESSAAVAAAEGEALAAGPRHSASGPSEIPPAVGAAPLAPPTMVAAKDAEVLSLGTAMQTHTADMRFVVIGSFVIPANADEHVAKHRDLRPFIVDAVVDGRRHRRVVVGPYDKADVKAAMGRVVMAGIADAWSLPVRGAGRVAPVREASIASLGD